MKRKMPIFNVLFCDWNDKKVHYVNVFELRPMYSITRKLSSLLKKHKKNLNKADLSQREVNKLNRQFAKDIDEQLQSWLLYHFRAKCEYEIIATDWPTSFDIDFVRNTIKSMALVNDCWADDSVALARLANAYDSTKAWKLDIYTQLMANYGIFRQMVYDYIGYVAP